MNKVRVKWECKSCSNVNIEDACVKCGKTEGGGPAGFVVTGLDARGLVEHLSRCFALTDVMTAAAELYGFSLHVDEDVQFRLNAHAVPSALTFDELRKANVARCIKWHPAGIASWSPSDWLTAVTGELGELASLLKMRNRERDGLPGNKFSPTDKMIADELADVQTYLDLLAAVLDVDLGRATVTKFNEVSERVGFSDRIREY